MSGHEHSPPAVDEITPQLTAVARVEQTIASAAEADAGVERRLAQARHEAARILRFGRERGRARAAEEAARVRVAAEREAREIATRGARETAASANAATQQRPTAVAAIVDRVLPSRAHRG